MEESAQSKLPQGTKIVMVEDDKFLGSLVAKKLVSEGCTVTSVSKGEEALGAIERETPDVILLDLLLPGISGFDILKKIKHDDRMKNIPVIVLSNLGEEKDIKMGQELGANNFLIKATLNIDEIVDEVAKVLKK